MIQEQQMTSPPGTTDRDYLRLLARQYPSIRAASTALIELYARLELPKGTEHFLSDIHGADGAFNHVMRNASGSIKRKIEETFPELSPTEQQELATLIYYPSERLSYILPGIEDPAAWFHHILRQLISLAQIEASKYTRANVEAFLPDASAAILEELLFSQQEVEARRDYYQGLIEAIVSTGSAAHVIADLAELIQRLNIARLHVIGDVYDRGPGAEVIMDTLLDHHNVDIQWGNHDIVWMGAAAGSPACMANVIRVSVRYANMETLINGYGISMLPLISFALETYGDDPCEQFMPRGLDEEEFTAHEIGMMARMQKAITIIQLKLEAQIIKRRPHYQMDDRLLLEKIDFEQGTITLDGKTHPLLDRNFPTIDPAAPDALSPQEQMVVDKLRLSFANSQRLQAHVRFLYANGGMYLVYNGNLLYHGCIPMNEDGSFMAFEVDGQAYQGRAFLDHLDRLARQGYFATDEPARQQYGQDTMWYLWSGAQSPLFGKEKMATFERYFLADESTHREERNPYYQWRDRVETSDKILREFGLDPAEGHIINGHVPVKVKKGESPLKAEGKLLVIDGGFAKAYQTQTGIAGYTLIFNSYGLLLSEHQPFESARKCIEEGRDMVSKTEILETNDRRIRVRDTDRGRAIQRKIDDLQRLLAAYRAGTLKSASDRRRRLEIG
jgi:fructose-1,6-bisphosphatase-3